MRRPAALAVLSILSGAFLGAGLVGCGSGTTSAIGPTPCPEVVAWVPRGLPTPPAGLAIRNGPDGVSVVNHTEGTVSVSVTAFTPLDCAFGLGTPMPSLLGPGHEASWSISVPRPAAGPVLGGLEVWLGDCGDRCARPADAYLELTLRPGS